MGLINYLGESKVIKKICELLNVKDVKVNGTSVVDSSGDANITISGNTDENVKQSPSSENKTFRVLLSQSENDTEETSSVKKAKSLLFNPSVVVVAITLTFIISPFCFLAVYILEQICYNVKYQYFMIDIRRCYDKFKTFKGVCRSCKTQKHNKSQ